MEKRLIKLAFYGKMGAGKTTASLKMLELLTERFDGENSIGYIITFAQPLKYALLAMHRNAKGSAERVFMQRLGDLARREFGEDVFEKILQENVDGLITNKLPTISQQNVLIMTDDLRFRGEYKLLRNLGFCIIQIETDDKFRKQRIGDAFTNTRHRSETEQEGFVPDFVIQNNGSQLEFEQALRHLTITENLFGLE